MIPLSMSRSTSSADPLLQQAVSLYARLVFIGHTDNWEEIDRALRAENSPEAKLTALRYHLANCPVHTFPAPLQNAIEKFLGSR